MKRGIVLIVVFLILLAGYSIYNFYPYNAIQNNAVIDSIVVLKSRHELLAYSKNILIKTYIVSIGRVSTGSKHFEGDQKTPEGVYFINSKNPRSAFHKNLGISYPNIQDIERARKIGKPPGGDIKIHGLRNGLEFIGRFQRWVDWTNGCIALTNEELDDLYEHTPNGTPIIINP